MATDQLEEGTVVGISVKLLDCRDKGNIVCLAGGRTILLDDAFLSAALDAALQKPLDSPAPVPPAQREDGAEK